MKSRKITYFKCFSLFFAIAVLLFIAGCTGVTVSSTVKTTYNGNGSTAGTVPVDPSSPYEYGATVTVLGNTGDLIRINDGGGLHIVLPAGTLKQMAAAQIKRKGLPLL